MIRAMVQTSNKQKDAYCCSYIEHGFACYEGFFVIIFDFNVDDMNGSIEVPSTRQ